MKMPKWLILAALCLLLTACASEAEVPTVATAPTAATVPATQPETQPETVPETEPPEEHFTLTFVGDCTLGSNPSNTYAQSGFVRTVGEDYDYPLKNVVDIFSADEATFANLEGALTDKGNATVKTHVFRGPTAYAQILTRGSVEFVSLANNHSMDYGQVGYDSTVDTLNSAGIPFVERDASRIFTTKNGLKIGVYGAVYYLLDAEDMVQEITAMREQGCDLVIYAPHWGVEGNYRPNETQTELGRMAIDAGADIVWGSHPHLLQPVEAYNDGWIFYSLGNFCFGGNGAPPDLDSAMLQLEVIRSADGTVRLGELTVIPVSISSVEKINNFQPTPYPEDSEEYLRVHSKLDGTWPIAHIPINKGI